MSRYRHTWIIDKAAHMIQTGIVDKIVNEDLDEGGVSPRLGAVDRILAGGATNLLTPAALRL
jgi:hypothetical protein